MTLNYDVGITVEGACGAVKASAEDVSGYLREWIGGSKLRVRNDMKGREVSSA
jgi:hypothetical protein